MLPHKIIAVCSQHIQHKYTHANTQECVHLHVHVHVERNPASPEATCDDVAGMSRGGRREVAGRSQGDCKACAFIDFDPLAQDNIKRPCKRKFPLTGGH